MSCSSTRANADISVLMVSTFPPDRDGIASYTARLEGEMRQRNIFLRIAANGRDWKRDSFLYIFLILRNALTSKASIVHIQLSYFMFGNEFYTGLYPLLAVGLRLLGKKVVITLHDIVQKTNLNNNTLRNYTSLRFLGFKCWALYYYTRIVCVLADKVIVHSEFAKEALLQDYGVSPKKIHVIPHGIDQLPSSSEECECLNSSYIQKNHQIVSYFGLIRHGKGLEDLVRAWKKIEPVNADLMIIGGKHPQLKDDCYELLVELIKKLGLESSIHFCSYVPTDSLPCYFNSSDVFVFPYNEWGEVIASSGALSMVAPYRKPIIATDVPAFTHLKELGGALIVKRGDIEGLALAIMKVLQDSHTRDSLVTKLSNWLPEYSWSNAAEKTVEVYRELT